MISKRQPEESVEDYIQRVIAAVDATRVVQLKVGDVWQVENLKDRQSGASSHHRCSARNGGMVEPSQQAQGQGKSADFSGGFRAVLGNRRGKVTTEPEFSVNAKSRLG